MISNIIKKITFVIVAVVVVTSCAKKLDLYPTNDYTPDKVYSTPTGYFEVLAKVYGGLASGGNSGPAGAPDISGGLDEGSQIAFIRPFFNCEELPTDEAVCAWNDQTIQDYHNLAVTSGDPFLKGMYARPLWNITLANEYLRNASDASLSAKGFSSDTVAILKNTRAEVRFLRAFNYWLMMDLFGKSTFVTEADLVGAGFPKEISRANLFNYVVGELKAIDGELKPAKTIEYGRVDQGASWALLARIYLNAEVYTGKAHYDSASYYASKVIAAPYSLKFGTGGYNKLFMADNDVNGKDEFIFSVQCDGAHTTGYGNTSFLTHAASGDDATAVYGVSGGGWYGYRGTSIFTDSFFTDPADKRGLIKTSSYNDPINFPITDISDFKNGIHVRKFINIRSDNGKIADPTGYFADIDFPVFRLAEMYLIYAEASLRTGANTTTALSYLNKLRERAYEGTTTGQLLSTDLSLSLILNERGRELYWEGHRRTDLIRYGLLTTNKYLWPWKGGVATGTAVDSKYNLFPIPASVLASNPNLTQNTGY